MQCNIVQCSAVQCSAVHCSAVICSAVQCSAVQCSAVQCSAVVVWDCAGVLPPVINSLISNTRKAVQELGLLQNRGTNGGNINYENVILPQMPRIRQGGGCI